MAGSLDFYFDFSSAYSALAWREVPAIAERHGLVLHWRPISLGVIFRNLGHAPPPADTRKGQYLRTDVERCAREQGLQWRWPKPFPFNSIPAARGFYWATVEERCTAPAYVEAIFNASFREGRDVSDSAELAAVAGELGIDAEAFAVGIADADVKQRLAAHTDQAEQAGVFGAPTVVVDGELFWGADRLAQLERWLERGGW